MEYLSYNRKVKQQMTYGEVAELVEGARLEIV